MKLSKQLIATAVAGSSIALTAAAPAANAEVSANVGFVSDYYFRGANLGDAGVYGGLDYAAGGFYAGTWWIDDATGGNDGMEHDWYLGYGGEVGDFSYDINYARYEYTYTSDFEHEIGVGLSVAGFSLGLVEGRDDDDGVDAVDYNVYTLGYEYDFFSATVGHFEDDTDYDYQWAEVSFSGDIAEGIGASLSIGSMTSDSESVDDGYMFLDVSKSFDL